MISIQNLIGLPRYEISEIRESAGRLMIWARYTGARCCPQCEGKSLRNQGAIRRCVRHVSWAARQVWLTLLGYRWLCRACGKQFRERFPGVRKGQRASEALVRIRRRRTLIPKETRTVFRAEGERFPERSEGRMALAEKGAAALSPPQHTVIRSAYALRIRVTLAGQHHPCFD